MKRKVFSFAMMFLLAFMPMSIFAYSGSGTSSNPYLIQNVSDWNTFAAEVAGGQTYSGVYFKLMTNISVTTMAGSFDRPFAGTFDGNNKTITVDYTATEGRCALFPQGMNLTIKNLKVTGTINTAFVQAAGFIGYLHQNGTIIDCVSDVTINSTVNGKGIHGGFIGELDSQAHATISNSVFTGRLLGPTTDKCGGFVGWVYSHYSYWAQSGVATVNFQNCIFAPKEVTMGIGSEGPNLNTISATFARSFPGSGSSGNPNTTGLTFNNCYYTQTFGTTQGSQIYSVSGADHVTVNFPGSNNNTTGVIVENLGLSCNGAVYVVNGNQTLGLNLNYTGSQVLDGFTATGGTLTGSSNPYSLAMNNQNVVISANTHAGGGGGDYPFDESDLHTLAMYGVGDNAEELIDVLHIDRPNGAWMEPYHFQLYNEGEEDVEVYLIDFLHNNGYFSMVEETEYPFTVLNIGRDGAVDLYLNTNIEWTDTEVINSLLAVNTNERSTHLYEIIAEPYMPYCPDVVEKAYPLGMLTTGQTWRMYASDMWAERNPNVPYNLHANYDMPDFDENIPDGYDAVIKFTANHDIVLNAYVNDGENGKVALYRADFAGEEGPMADNYYVGRPFNNIPSGEQPPYQATIGEGTTTTGYFPMYYLYNNSLSTQLFHADELAAAGANTAPMSSVSWYSESTYGYNIQNVSIWMANVADNTVTATSPLGSNMTLVYSGNHQEVVGWNEFVFNQNNFGWDGQSNVLVMVQMNNGNWSSSIQWFAHNPGFQAGSYNYRDNAPYNAGAETYSMYTSNTLRANTIFKSNGGRMIAGTPRGNRATAIERAHLTQTRSGYMRGGSMTNWNGINRGSTAYGICVYNDGTLDLGINQFDIDDLASASVINDFNDIGGMVYNPNNGHFYVSSYNNYELYEVDADGNILNTVETDYGIVSLAWDQTTNTLYSMDSYGWLNITDPTTGEMTDIDALSNENVMCMTADANGQLFGVLYGETSALVSINKNDASVTTLVTLDAPCNYAQSMAFDLNDNKLYWAQCYDDGANLYEINPTTGALTLKAANTSEICGLCIPANSTPTPPTPPTPVDPTYGYTAGPVIQGLNVLAGTYYLVASSTDPDFEVVINAEEMPCPIAAVTNIYPEDNAWGIPSNNLTLTWRLDDYCNEWRIVFGSTYYPEDEPEHPATYISEWSSNLAESIRITDYVQLWDNTNYFWRIEQRSNPGTPYECVTSGPVFGFTTTFDIPQNLQVNGAGDAYIFETEQDVTLTWNAIQDRTYRRYRIYWNGELYYETPNNQVVTSYTIPNSEFHYNMVPHVPELFNVTAVYDEGESLVSNTVAVHVSGYGSVSGTVYEQDETTPIGGVTVLIQGTNEFGNAETYTFVTDEDGYYEGEVHVGEYHSAIASMEGYQSASTVHELPFDVVYQEETDHVDFYLDEVFYAPAHVCAETVFVPAAEGDSLVHVWWDFDFYTALIEDFEDFENTTFDWENSATYPWTITTNNPYEGTYCLKSGGAGVNNVVSDLSVTVDIPNDGIMSFFVKASCENNWDFGYFYIDGEQRGSYTGAGNWGEKQFAITAGTHTFRWSYQKDGSVNSNDDCIYIDYIQFNRLPEPPVPGAVYDFDNSSMNGWTDIDADGDGYSWMLASEVMGEGYGVNGSTDCVLSQSYNNNVGVLYPDNYLVSPQVQLGGIFKFFACAQDASYAAEHFGVAVSTTNGTSASAFTTIQEWTMSAKSLGESKPVYRNTRSGRAQGNWYEYTVDLSAYAGQTGYVAIRHFNCSDMFYLDVDDILIGDASKSKAMDETRSLHHYNIYRTDCYNDGPYNSDNTVFLASVWRPDTSYVDVQWPEVPVGVYKYGVSAVYQGNQADNPNNPRVDYPFEERESEIVWHDMCSPCIDKDMYLNNEVTINVVLNSADSPEGTVVTFVNNNEGEQFNHPMAPLTLDQTGYYEFPRFRKGDYTITIEHEGFFTLEVEESIWEPRDLRYVLIEKIFNARDLYVSRTGWAMWQPNGTLSNPEDDPMLDRHLEGYKVMCTSIDGEPIFNHNTPADQPFCQLATDELVEGEHYIVNVAAIYSTGMSDYISAEWQYEPCDHYAGTVNGVTAEGNTITWDYPGGVTPGPTPPPAGENSFNFGFENGFEGWTTIDNDGDGLTWVNSVNSTTASGYDYTGLAHGGNYFVYSQSYIDYDGAYNADNYLVTPQKYAIVNGSTLTFFADNANDSYPDHFAIAVSTADTPTAASFTDIWSHTGAKAGEKVSMRHSNDNRYENWRQHTVDMSAYAGQNVWIALHHQDYDEYEIWIDDVVLTPGAKSTLAGMFASANGRPSFEVAPNGMSNRDGWYYYDNGTNYDAIGLTAGGGFWWGIMFPAGSYEGNVLTKVSYYDNGVSTGQVLICQGGTDAPGTQLYAQDYTTTGSEDFIEINMNEPVAIDATQNLWVVMHNTSGQYVASYDGASPGETNGSWLSIDNISWYESLYSATGGSYGGNWNLRAYLESGVTPPTPPTPAEGILGAMIFVDGEWEAFVEYPTNTYTYEGEGQEICVRIVYDGTAQLPDNNFYYAMSCEECIGGIEPQPECEAGAPIYAEVNGADDQVHIYWNEQPVPPTPEEGDTFEYDFDNSSLDGLTQIDADGDGYIWTIGSTTMSTGIGHNGSVDMVQSASYINNVGAVTPDNYLVFPQSSITNGSTFSFWACGQDASWAGEHFGVAISTTGNTSAADFTTIQEWTMTAKGTKAVRDGRDQGNWYQYTVDLSDYAGMDVYIAIRHFNCTDMFYLDVDDVELGIANKGNRDGIIGYNIYRSTDNVDYVLIATVDGDVTEYFDAPGAGTYYYQVTALYDGCESDPAISGENPDQNYVVVGVTGIGENSTIVNLFPNPTKGNVTIQAMNMHRITVVSVLGQVVFDTELDQDEYILNMAKFNTGVYMVRVYTDEGVTVKRVTVLH